MCFYFLILIILLVLIYIIFFCSNADDKRKTFIKKQFLYIFFVFIKKDLKPITKRCLKTKTEIKNEN